MRGSYWMSLLPNPKKRDFLCVGFRCIGCKEEPSPEPCAWAKRKSASSLNSTCV